MFTKCKIWCMISIFFNIFINSCFDCAPFQRTELQFDTRWRCIQSSSVFGLCYQCGLFVCSVTVRVIFNSLAQHVMRYHVPGLKLEDRHFSTFQTFILFFCRNHLWGTCVEPSDAPTKTVEPRSSDLWGGRRPESVFHLGTNKPTTINNKLLQLEILQYKIIKTCLSLLFLFALFKNPLWFFSTARLKHISR